MDFLGRRTGEHRPVAKRGLTGFWKFLVITLPLITLAILVVYLLQNISHTGLTSDSATQFIRWRLFANARTRARRSIGKARRFHTIRYLALGLVLPLAAIHFWLATARDG